MRTLAASSGRHAKNIRSFCEGPNFRRARFGINGLPLETCAWYAVKRVFRYRQLVGKSLALEAKGNVLRALDELKRALDIDPSYSDAMFNLAQIMLKSGDIATAKPLVERYLASNPPAERAAATARKAIIYCTARLMG
jgi:tetratricopeptide (TPR) repeat protein